MDGLLCYSSSERSFTVGTLNASIGVDGMRQFKPGETGEFHVECKGGEDDVSPKILARDCSGDGLSDIVCLKNASPISISKAKFDAGSNKLSFEQFKTGFASDWCPESSRLYVEDFNGDNKSDIICHTQDRNWKFFDMATKQPSDILTAPATAGRGCKNTEITLFGDYNGDGKTDVICRNTETKKLSLYLGLGMTTGALSDIVDGEVDDGCAGYDMYVGKFVPGAMSTLLCHDNKSLRFAKRAGEGLRPMWMEVGSFDIKFCRGELATLHVGDFFGMSKQSLLCHRGGGKIEILQNVWF
jgi:hypothetical protein